MKASKKRNRTWRMRVRERARGMWNSTPVLWCRQAAAAFGRWLWLQVREIKREISAAVRPPVKMRRHGNNSLAIRTTAAGGAEGVVVLPLAGRGVVGVCCSETTLAYRNIAEYPYGVEAYSDGPDGRQVWNIAAFKHQRDAQECATRIGKALAGGGGAASMLRWAIGVVVLVMVLSLLRPGGATASQPGAPAASVPGATPAPVAALMRDAFGASPASAGMAPAAAYGPSAIGATGSALADEIYAASMAAAQAARYNGPPTGPAPVTGAADFGLGNSVQGCDPALQFTVAPTP